MANTVRPIPKRPRNPAAVVLGAHAMPFILPDSAARILEVLANASLLMPSSELVSPHARQKAYPQEPPKEAVNPNKRNIGTSFALRQQRQPYPSAFRQSDELSLVLDRVTPPH